MLLGELEQLDARIQARILTELLTTFYLAEESVSVRRRAIESASYACTPEILDALELAYYDGKAPMRMSAVVGMGRSGDQRWKEIILDELGSESPAMRYEAAWASGEMSLRPAVPLLARLIDDPDPQVSFAAIWALGQIGGERAKQTLVAAYDVADDDTQAALDDALAELALLEGDLEFLLYELGADPDDEWLDDEYTALWTADDDTDQFDGDSRDLDDI
jgi:HEAT repeat protein